MLLTPKQNLIVKDKSRFRVVNAGRRFGKTVLAVEEIIGCATTLKDRRIAYIAPTFQQARDIAWEQLKARCAKIATNINESQLKITVKTIDNGTSIIQLKSWDSIESLRGQKFHFIVIDEVAMMRYFWVGWQEVIRPTLTDTKGSVLFISTPKGFNHFYELYSLEGEDKNFKSFHATSYDNPHLDPEEIDAAKEQLTEDQFAQEYLGDFRKQEGLVYKEFLRDRHLTDQEPNEAQTLHYYAGVDFGFTNPTAILHIKKDIHGVYWVVDEWYKTGQTDEEIADYIWNCRFEKVYADPERPSTIKAIQNKHIYVAEVVKNKDSIVNGISKVRNMFKQGKIKVHTRCKNTIFELENYRYPDRKPNANESEVPVKELDHALDALRYVIMMTDEQRHISHRDIITQRQERMRNIKNNAR